MKKRKNNNLIKWFRDEGALTLDGKVYYAERTFLAHSAVNWLRKRASDKKLKGEELNRYMEVIKLFLQKKVDLKWEDDIISVIVNEEEVSHNESNRVEATNGQ